MFARVELVYMQGGQKLYIDLMEGVPSGVSLVIDSSCPAKLKCGNQFSVFLIHDQPLELLDFQIELAAQLHDTASMLINGFQSWSTSTELGPADRIPSPFKGAHPIFSPYGDYRFHRYSGRRGRLHSWTYTYFNYPGDTVLLLGSLNESAGYTLFDYNYNRDRLIIRRDCAGALSEGSYPLLQLYIGQGDQDAVFDEYFSRLDLPRRIAPRATGWTSWYNYYTNISEEIALHNLKELSRLDLPLDYFQVDDGWQEAIGDWLEHNAKFPSGMASLAAAVRERGLKPGLWLAPFICDRRSRLFHEHPEWLLKNSKGKPVKAGFNPLWSGWFYALDFYAPGFQDYLSRVFATVQEQWGFEMLKLDFLYAAALLPRQGKSRGRVMTEVMDFIHRQAKDVKLLGCGVPLGPALGRVDYCRIGSDVAPFWEFFAKGLHYRERISTINSLTSTIGRRHLDRRAFRSDPDVFLLRDGVAKVNRNRLNPHQRYTLFFLNNLLGGLVLFSDNVDGYTKEQIQTLRSGFPALEARVVRVSQEQGLYRLEFTVGKKRYLAYANVSASPREAVLEDSLFFHPELFVLHPGTTLRLEPYQTRCLFQVEPKEDKAYLLGGTGHIYPGAQVQRLMARAKSVTLQLHPQASPESRIFLAAPRGVINLQVNKKNYAVTLKNRCHFITVPYPGPP